MNNRLSICILLCLAMLASGLAEAQGTYGTKVQAGDPDIGLPLSNFAAIGSGAAGGQSAAYIAYWDIGASPGLFDDQDIAYLQFGGFPIGFLGNKIVRTNNIRLTGWSTYPAGSYVKSSDSDIGQQLMTFPPLVQALPSGVQADFYYMNVNGGGYDMGDPVYLKVQSPPGLPGEPIITGANDIRITVNAGLPAGSRVSLNDPDAGNALTLFYPPVFILAAGGPNPTAPAGPIAQLSFFNTNGNSQGPFAAIFDDGDVVYFDTTPVGIVSPNDIRLF